MKKPIKTINRRKSRKATGEWAEHVIDLRKRVHGVGRDKRPICTQAELAEALQVSAITVSRWELGKQDPPPRERARLAFTADTLGLGRDLELAFRAGAAQEKMIRDSDRAIIDLVRYLFLSQPWLADSDQVQLHRLAKAIFDLARAVAVDGMTSRFVTPQRQLVSNEMVRLVKQVQADEAGVFAKFARLFGTKMYTDVQEEGTK